MKRHLKRFVLVGALAGGLSGCGGFETGEIFESEFWNLRESENTLAEVGMAEMAKGNHITAEAQFQKALKNNPKDVHALLGLGMLYQNSGQVTKAREMYEAVLALRPQATERFMIWKSLSTRPISEVASVNLALLESGGVLTDLGRGQAGQAQSSYMPGDVAKRTSGAMIKRVPGVGVQGAAAPQPMVGPGQGAAAPVGDMAQAQANVMSRFATVRALRDQGLITQEEYATRRQANIGALLPLTSPPPAAGLDRPVPTTEQISGRLRAIGRALEMRAVSVGQHASERNMILDALMPSAPVVVANPALPPKGLLEAADQVRRLEQMRNDRFITSDEYTRERAAIEKAMQPAPPKRPKAAEVEPTPLEGGKAKMTGPQPAVHLASYRSQKAADRGLAQLKRAHRRLLAGLEPEISKVSVRGKGTYWRLKMGPVDSEKAAKSLCRQLKRKGQYCVPSMMVIK